MQAKSIKSAAKEAKMRLKSRFWQDYKRDLDEGVKIAKEEGFNDIATHFERVLTVEKSHNERYDKLLERVKQKEMFKSPTPILWECGNCGYHVISENAPEICPLCEHPKSYFFKKADTL